MSTADNISENITENTSENISSYSKMDGLSRLIIPMTQIEDSKIEHMHSALDSKLVHKLKEVCQRESIALDMMLLTVFYSLLYRYTGQNGIPLKVLEPATKQEILLRLPMSEIPTVAQLTGMLAREVKPGTQTIGHQVNKPIEGEVAFNHVGSFVLGLVDKNQNGFEQVWDQGCKSNYILSFSQSATESCLHFAYNSTVVDEKVIGRFLDHFIVLLESILASGMEEKITNYKMISANEEEIIRNEWNHTSDVISGELLHTLFIKQAKWNGEQLAVISPSCTITYTELYKEANKIGRTLVTKGVRPNKLVAVVMEKGWEQVVAVMGILFSGAAYLPVDPKLPKDRIRHLLKYSEVEYVLTQKQLNDELEWPNFVERMCVDTEDFSQEEDSQLDMIQNPSDIAYVIFTSGSTGLPKGVVIDHVGAVNTILDINRRFHVTSDDRVFSISSLSFDLSVYDIFGALAAGATVVIPDDEQILDPQHWIDNLKLHQVTIWNSAPPLAKILADYIENTLDIKVEQLPLRLVMMSGDWIPLSLPGQLKKICPRAETISLGGATEASIWSIFYPIKDIHPDWKSIPYGKPMTNQSFFVLNESFQLCPVGVPGELYIGGIGLAKEYWKDEAKTKHSFIFHPELGERLYRTGDQGCYMEDGNIEFLGRVDNQVKIRGFRVELGEIQSVLRKHPSVLEAVVLARDDIHSEKCLVAYMIPKDKSQKIDVNILHDFLGRKLPEYMVPSFIVEIDQFPVTVNGKLDRKALPIPALTETHLLEDEEPMSATEKHIADLWSEIFNIRVKSKEANFFHLGGQSLDAIQIVSKIRMKYQIHLPVNTIFDHPTVALLGQQVENLIHHTKNKAADKMKRIERKQRLRLSYAQKRLWFLEQLEPNAALYNLPFIMKLSGQLDLEAFHQSLSAIMNRHEILRTSFGAFEGEPYQTVLETKEFPLQYVDLRENEDRAERWKQIFEEEARAAFDFSAGYLIRGKIIQLEAEVYCFILTMHHIISDGWSVEILAQELSVLYDSFYSGKKAWLPEMEIQYADFAATDTQQDYDQWEKQLTYWKEKLHAPLPVLALPHHFPRPAVMSYTGTIQTFSVPKHIVSQLKEICRSEGVTMFMILLSAYKVLLHRYSGQEDIIVGAPIVNRHVPEVEKLIGFFVNMLPLRTTLSGSDTFRQLLRKVQRTATSAYANQQVPFEKMVEELQPERSTSHSPIFQTLFQILPPFTCHLTGLSVEMLEADTKTSKFDLSLTMKERGDQLAGRLEYSTDLFSRKSIQRMIDSFLQIVSAIVESLDQPISMLPVLSKEEKALLFEEWNGTECEYPDMMLADWFVDQVHQTPNQVAVIYEGQYLTYKELDHQSNQVANYLKRNGVQAETLVGVCMDRSIEMVVTMLGIVKAGGAYVPLDPSYPTERLQYMLTDSGVTVLVTHHDDHSLTDTNMQIIRWDLDREKIENESSHWTACLNSPDSLLSIIYTSGSTGSPKGVMITQRNLCQRLFWMQDTYQLTAQDRILHKTPISFDVSVWEIFWPLMVGASVVVPQPEGHKDPKYLIDTIRKENVTIVHFIPSMLGLFLEEEGVEKCTSLRQVMSGGEVLSPALVKQFYSKFSVPLHNRYGPTESTINATCYECKPGDSQVPIGKPLANTKLYVLDKNKRPVPIGVVGELYIGGSSVARGYINNKTLTAEKFVQNPFSLEQEDILYKSGDLVRYLEDGNIQFIGRQDSQIKLRGYRIELGEIEEALRKNECVKEAVVLLVQEGNPSIIAYVTENQKGAVSNEKLRHELGSILPKYMIPAKIIVMEKLPLFSTGKIDRLSLPIPLEENMEVATPRNDFEARLMEIWKEILQTEQISIHSDFFNIGGHSLLGVKLIMRIRKSLSLDIPLRVLFEKPTIAQMAEFLKHSKKRDQQADSDSSIRKGQDCAKIPASPEQKRLFFFDQLESNNSVYNVPLVLRLHGALSVSALEYSVQKIVQRHDILRTTIYEEKGEIYQRIRVFDSFEMSVVDFSAEHESAEQEREKEQVYQCAIHKEAERAFDLRNESLFRVVLYKLSTTSFILQFTIHHIIFDGWSRTVLIDELKRFYEEYTLKLPLNVPDLPVQFSDYSIDRNRSLEHNRFETELNDWKEQLQGVSPICTFPSDYSRPATQTYHGKMHRFTLSKEMADKLKELAKQQKVTLYILLLTVFKLLLSKASGQEDIVVGTPVANRNRPEHEAMIGFFVNTLVLRTDMSGNPSFTALLEKVKLVVINAFSNGEVPFEKVVEEVQQERNRSYSPLFQVMFAYQKNEPNVLDFSDLQVEYLEVERDTAKFDFTLFIEEHEDHITAVIEYNTGLFAEATAIQYAQQYCDWLERLITNPSSKVRELTIGSTSAIDEESLDTLFM